MFKICRAIKRAGSKEGRMFWSSIFYLGAKVVSHPLGHLSGAGSCCTLGLQELVHLLQAGKSPLVVLDILVPLVVRKRPEARTHPRRYWRKNLWSPASLAMGQGVGWKLRPRQLQLPWPSWHWCSWSLRLPRLDRGQCRPGRTGTRTAGDFCRSVSSECRHHLTRLRCPVSQRCPSRFCVCSTASK